MSWEGWIGITALAALALDVVRRLVQDALAKGLRMAKDDQQTKDITGIDQKVEHVRKELRVEIAGVRSEHNDLREKVNEIATTTAANHALLGAMNDTLNILVKSHHSE